MSGGTNLTNAASTNELHQLLDRLIEEVTERGVYATASLQFAVSDGIIQETSMAGETSKQFRPPKRKK